MVVDLTKIQSVIETEVDKAITNERKRIVIAVGSFSKDLIDEIKNGGEQAEEDEAPAKPTRGKADKETPESDNTPEKDKADEEDGYDISEVEDEEANESDYAKDTGTALRAKCEDRDLNIPRGYKKLDIIKLLILADEDK